MASNINLLPRANDLYSGKILSPLSSTATSVDVDNPPIVDYLPKYITLEPGTANTEVIRVYDVSGSTIYFERGINRGGVGVDHPANAPFQETTSSHFFNKLADAIESGWLTEDLSFTFTKNSDTQFVIDQTGVDRTGIYAKGKLIRINGSLVGEISSSSYVSNQTVVDVDGITLPDTITKVEIGIGPKEQFDLSNRTFDKVLLKNQPSTPTTPSTGKSVVYVKSDGYLYYLDENGVERRYYPPVVDNNVAYSGKDGSGAIRQIAKINGSNKLEIGDNGLSGIQFIKQPDKVGFFYTASGAGKNNLKVVYLTTVKQTTGGSASETFSTDISGVGFSSTPTGIAQLTDTSSTSAAYFVHYLNDFSSKTTAVVELRRYDEGTIAGGILFRYTLLLFGT